jgi:Domain of unknown function (DUF397)
MRPDWREDHKMISALNLVWRTSSSCTGGNCAEVATVDGGAAVALRNSTYADRVLVFSALAWDDFLAGVRMGEFALSSR